MTSPYRFLNLDFYTLQPDLAYQSDYSSHSSYSLNEPCQPEDSQCLADGQKRVKETKVAIVLVSVFGVCCFGLTVVYFIVTVGTLLAITFGLGYDAWDSTLIHSPNAFVRYLGISLGPAFFYSMIHQRMIEIITIDPTSMFVKVCPARCCCPFHHIG